MLTPVSITFLVAALGHDWRNILDHDEEGIEYIEFEESGKPLYAHIEFRDASENYDIVLICARDLVRIIEEQSFRRRR